MTTANEIDFITYSQLTANVYPEGKDQYNPLLLNEVQWQRLELFDSNNLSRQAGF